MAAVLQNPEPLKASAIMPLADLRRERPALLPYLDEQDALIQYTLTPVKAAETAEVVGVLVSGEIVNRNLSIPENVLTIFKNGYSAIYQRQEDGSLALTTSLDAGDNAAIGQAVPDRTLDHPPLLKAAVANPGELVSQRGQVAGRTYTLAAKAIQGFDGDVVAILVRGTSETALNRLIANSLKLQLLVILLSVRT